MITTKRMRLAALALAATAALAFGGAGAAQAAPPDSPAIPLNTGQETPAPTVGGAHGTFSYEIEGDQLCWELEVRGLSSGAVAAHIHLGERNVAGPVVVPLTVETGSTSFRTEGCATPSPDVLAGIEADPSAYYVNVHTSSNPPGEIRGQLK